MIYKVPQKYTNPKVMVEKKCGASYVDNIIHFNPITRII